MDMMGGAESLMGIDLLNLQLGLVDRDFDEDDYEASWHSTIRHHAPSDHGKKTMANLHQTPCTIRGKLAQQRQTPICHWQLPYCTAVAPEIVHSDLNAFDQGRLKQHLGLQTLLALDRNNHGNGAPISEEQLAALPHHSYTSAKQVPTFISAV